MTTAKYTAEGTPAISNTAAIKRVLRNAGLPLTTGKQWGTTPGLLVKSGCFVRVMVADRHAEAETLAAAADILENAGAPVHRSLAHGFISIYE